MLQIRARNGLKVHLTDKVSVRHVSLFITLKQKESLASAKILYELCGFYRPRYLPYLDINSASFCILFKINGDTSKNGPGFKAAVKLIN